MRYLRIQNSPAYHISILRTICSSLLPPSQSPEQDTDGGSKDTTCMQKPWTLMAEPFAACQPFHRSPTPSPTTPTDRNMNIGKLEILLRLNKSLDEHKAIPCGGILAAMLGDALHFCPRIPLRRHLIHEVSWKARSNSGSNSVQFPTHVSSGRNTPLCTPRAALFGA